MPFIGKQPEVGAYSKLDAITTSATATYNLTLDSGAYYPSSANHLLVSLNGVMQAPQDSFTVSGSTIVFASTLASTDSIDFIMALGDVLDIGTPSDGTVTTAKIVDNSISTAKIQDAAVTDAKIATGITATKLTGALPAISGAALTNLPVLGVGQSWTDVKSSRAAATTYTNSTGKPIVVSIIVNAVVGAATSVYLSVDGLRISAHTDTDNAYQVTLDAIVPNGSTYLYTQQSTTSPINYWHELR